MKTQHAGDCSIYASVSANELPHAGICTCGFAHDTAPGDTDVLYSAELRELLEYHRKRSQFRHDILHRALLSR